MKVQDYLVSPVIKSWDNDITFTEKINKSKQNVFDTRSLSTEAKNILPEVVDSWMRSYNSGIDLSGFSNIPILDTHSFQALCHEKDLLIKAANPYLDLLKKIMSGNKYLFFLTDDKGVILRLFAEKEIKKQVEKTFSLFPGAFWSEKTVGTCSHSLSILLKKPIKLCSPEYYKEEFNSYLSVCASAPIFNANDILAGTLTIVNPFPGNQNAYSLSLAIPMALAIQNELQLADRKLQAAALEKSDSKKVRIDNRLESRLSFNEILGCSPQIASSINKAKKFAALNANILIQGESGTGKELFAQAIHNEARPHGPFIAINCSAIPKNLIESELFGYERGAFTSAEHKGKLGKIELANEGTLFLDEIGDMPVELQPVLLRVLEEKKIMRVGGNKYIPVNFRLIAATNRDLHNLVRDNLFREDLYYRLAALKIKIPPLRERETDVGILVQHFINKISEEQRIPKPFISDLALSKLFQYNWPGNVRQLANALLYAVNVTNDGIIKPEDLPDEIVGSNLAPVIEKNIQQKLQPEINYKDLTLIEMERMTILQALLKTKYNMTKAANILGMSRSSLYRKINKYHLKDIRL